MEYRNDKIEFNPIFTFGIVGRCRLDTLREIKDFFERLEDFETIYVKTTKSKKLFIKEEGEY
jgi:hypothetical protein